MTGFEEIRVSSQQISQYNTIQKKTFFSKADQNLYTKSKISKIVLKKILKAYYANSHPKYKILSHSNKSLIAEIISQDKKILCITNNLKNQPNLSFFTSKVIGEKLSGKNISCTTYFAIDTKKKIIPFDYCIYSYVEGKTLFDLFETQKLLSKECRLLGKTIAKVHKISTEECGLLDVNEAIKNKKLKGLYLSWNKFLSINIKKHTEFCLQHNIITKKEKNRIQKILQQAFANIKIRKPVLLHGDLANHNAIYHLGKITLIDWEDALSGDPLYDIAYYATGAINHPDWFENFIRGYSSIKKIPSNSSIAFWTYFLRISLAKAVSRYHEISIDEKSLPSVGLRIRKGLEILENALKI